MVVKASSIFSDLREAVTGRALIIGIGNEMKRDDGIGPFVAGRLEGKLSVPVMDCGPAPENYTGPIRNLRPETIIMIDAVDHKGKPGSVKLLRPNELKDETFTTHSVSLKTFADFISSETGARVLLLAVQPAGVSFGTGLSEAARVAAGMLEEGLVGLFGNAS